MHPPVSSAAARRAHQQRAERAPDARLSALERLAATLRQRPLQTIARFDGPPEMRTLEVTCRVDQHQVDYDWIYAQLDAHGWQPDYARLSRHTARYDHVRLNHPPTGARILLQIALPAGRAAHWDQQA